VVIVILVATAVAVADFAVVVVVLIVFFLIKIIRCNVLMTLCRATADCSKLPAT